MDKFLSEFEVCHEILHDVQRDHELDSEYCRSDYIYTIATDCCTECTSKQKGNKISAVFRGLIRPARGTCHLVLSTSILPIYLGSIVLLVLGSSPKLYLLLTYLTYLMFFQSFGTCSCNCQNTKLFYIK